jgi:thiamine pyrophosphokinase
MFGHLDGGLRGGKLVKVLIMANGAYGSLEWYRQQRGRFTKVICADGGAYWAWELGIVPDVVIGDLDSLPLAVRRALEEKGVAFSVYPAEKDDTDTQLAYRLAQELGASEVTVWGGVGSRLDHTLANICSAVKLVESGIRVSFEAPELTIYLVAGEATIPGEPGETVSVLALGGRAEGVNLEGFCYPLTDGVINGNWQYAVSNVIVQPNPVVRVKKGVVAVFHYRQLPD